MNFVRKPNCKESTNKYWILVLFMFFQGPNAVLMLGLFVTMAIIIKVMCMGKEIVTFAEEFKPKAFSLLRERVML